MDPYAVVGWQVPGRSPTAAPTLSAACSLNSSRDSLHRCVTLSSPECGRAECGRVITNLAASVPRPIAGAECHCAMPPPTGWIVSLMAIVGHCWTSLDGTGCFCGVSVVPLPMRFRLWPVVVVLPVQTWSCYAPFTGCCALLLQRNATPPQCNARPYGGVTWPAGWLPPALANGTYKSSTVGDSTPMLMVACICGPDHAVYYCCVQ